MPPSKLGISSATLAIAASTWPRISGLTNGAAAGSLSEGLAVE
jgi:hypothetical protein